MSDLFKTLIIYIFFISCSSKIKLEMNSPKFIHVTYLNDYENSLKHCYLTEYFGNTKFNNLSVIDKRKFNELEFRGKIITIEQKSAINSLVNSKTINPLITGYIKKIIKSDFLNHDILNIIDGFYFQRIRKNIRYRQFKYNEEAKYIFPFISKDKYELKLLVNRFFEDIKDGFFDLVILYKSHKIATLFCKEATINQNLKNKIIIEENIQDYATPDGMSRSGWKKILDFNMIKVIRYKKFKIKD
ncbi:MAG: hypothetical protein GY830_10735 [Bacteroidetes bacterium]|nr:hypothetical protein [Bacteroidota bacterium]